ncbi:MAG TPA: hypothetical protein VNZ55_11620 [Thermomicrobiales bacterium]|nr:hypothetical protein [Thermomicrobiales bacterium]
MPIYASEKLTRSIIHAGNARLSRRQFAARTAGIAAIAAAGSLAGLPVARASAQSMDPFTYIRTMPATDNLGQLPGQAATEIDPVEADGAVWETYIQLPIKEGQDFHYTCEFDSAWIILTAFGKDLSLEDQLALVGQDTSIEPYYEEREDGVIIVGGDIWEHFSGHYEDNFLARATGNAMRKVFDGAGLTTEPVHDRKAIEAALEQGRPVFFKSSVDFLDWVPATWITPDGDEFPVVLGNDHALIVMGANADDVIIRDPLGPTSTNTERPYQYRVTWQRFLEVFAAQGNDGVAVGPAPSS